MNDKQIKHTLYSVGIVPSEQDLNRIIQNIENIETINKICPQTAEFNLFPLNLIKTDVKEKIMKLAKNSLSKTEIASKLKITYKTAFDHMQQLINSGVIKEEVMKDKSGIKKIITLNKNSPERIREHFLIENKNIIKKYV